MKKARVKVDKLVYLGMTILDISKTLMYEFWYDYLKPMYKDKIKLCYMNTERFIINIFTEDFFEDVNKDVERWYDTFNYDENNKRPLKIGLNKKVIEKFKDELGGKIMKEFCALRAKTYAYLLDDDNEIKRAKGTKRCVINRRLMFGNFMDSLFNNKIIMQTQMRFKSDHHEAFTEEINKIARNYPNNKRLQTFYGITIYPHGTKAFKVCESEMLVKKKAIPIKLYYNEI